MPEKPRTKELLHAARATLLEDLLPALPPERKYEALMIANVMAIAAREFDAGDIALARQLQQLEPLYADGLPIAGLASSESLELLEKKLVADIRSGRFDASLGGPIRESLLALTRARLSISNPKYLQQWDTQAAAQRREAAP